MNNTYGQQTYDQNFAQGYCQQPPYFSNPMQPQRPQYREMPIFGIVRRAIGNPADITPQEVPMDGNLVFFPAQDGSFIIAKRWTSNGEIATMTYILQKDPTPEDENSKLLHDIMERLEKIEKQASRRQTKKEVEVENRDE